MRLFHEGQFEGRKVRLPVFLGRRPSEPVDKDLRSFYKSLLETVNTSSFREGQWNLCDRTGWPDNASFQNLGGLELAEGRSTIPDHSQSQRLSCSSARTSPLGQ